MTDLNTLLDTQIAPDPHRDLSARIVGAAATARPANDHPTRGGWWKAAASIAAAAIIGFGVFGMSGQDFTDTSAEWKETAETAGFGDLYAWTLETES